MIPVYKLERLPPGQRRRKLALLLTGIERSLAGGPGAESFDPDYLRGLVSLALLDDKLAPAFGPDIALLLEKADDSGSYLRLSNHARHALLAAIGTFPAEWDLVMPEASADAAPKGGAMPAGLVVSAGTGAAGNRPANSDPKSRRLFHPGMEIYAEDIRSPFNLGSIFRTAEAFGAEKVLISPLCVPPTHPRALRSAMGCIEYLEWERKGLAELPGDVPVFALETGGTPIGEFDFPEKGIVIIGSEELGISPEGLARATYGRVSIPMTGIKASLNVGVAFGILMQAWTAYIPCSLSKPF